MINGETAYRLKGGFIEVLNKKLSSVWSHQAGAAAAAANFPPGGTTRVKRKKIMLLLEKSQLTHTFSTANTGR